MCGAISTWLAFDRNIALEGCWGRWEGLYSILYYLSVMLLTTFVSNKYKKFIVHCILLCGAIQAIYGIFQCYSLFNVKQFIRTHKYFDKTIYEEVTKKEIWVTGLTNNPNFFGSYMLMCLSYSFGLLLECKKNVKNIIYCLYIALFMFTLLISNTTSAVVSLIFVGLLIMIYCVKNKKIIKLLIIASILSIITMFAFVQGKTTLVKDIEKTGTEATEVAKGNLDDSYGTKRMYIWKRTVEIIPKHIWHGVGIDSFHKAFDGEALTRKTSKKIVLYDKAHNEYLQILITEGIFGLLAYLFLYGYVVIYGLKRGFKYGEMYLVLPVIGYLVQAFFNISVLEVAPIFWMALGLCSGKNETFGDGLNWSHFRYMKMNKWRFKVWNRKK